MSREVRWMCSEIACSKMCMPRGGCVGKNVDSVRTRYHSNKMSLFKAKDKVRGVDGSTQSNLCPKRRGHPCRAAYGTGYHRSKFNMGFFSNIVLQQVSLEKGGVYVYTLRSSLTGVSGCTRILLNRRFGVTPPPLVSRILPVRSNFLLVFYALTTPKGLRYSIPIAVLQVYRSCIQVVLLYRNDPSPSVPQQSRRP